jgi:hypothetical protein
MQGAQQQGETGCRYRRAESPVACIECVGEGEDERREARDEGGLPGLAPVEPIELKGWAGTEGWRDGASLIGRQRHGVLQHKGDDGDHTRSLYPVWRGCAKIVDQQIAGRLGRLARGEGRCFQLVSRGSEAGEMNKLLGCDEGV